MSELLDRPGRDLHQHLSGICKNFRLEDDDNIDKDIDDENEVIDKSGEDGYKVMTDSEPYMNFCPQIFMY